MEANQKRKASYIIRHWKGELSLPVSFWVNGILITVLSLVFVPLFTSILSFEKFPKVAALIIVVLIFMSLLITIWQLVGIWRSATQHSLKKDKIVGSLTKGVVVLMAMQFGYSFVDEIVPQLKAFSRIAINQDPFGRYELRILKGGLELELFGYIGFGVTDKIKKYLDTHPTIQFVCLNSDGGRVTEARKLANLIMEKNLSTCTTSGCFSACVLPFAAGKERLIAKNAKLGFHCYSFPGVKQEDLSSAYEKDRQYLLSRGINDLFVSRMYTIMTEKLWYPTHEELMQARFITGSLDTHK